MPTSIQQDEEDVARYGDSYAPPVAAPPSYISTAQAVAPPLSPSGSPPAVIDAAVAQLNAGQPVTALPRQSWDFQQQQAWVARMNAFDEQAKAARIARDAAARDAQMLDQMARVAKSTKDIQVALQQQDAQGFMNWVAGGGNPVQGLLRFPRAATSPVVSAARLNQPAPVTPAPQEVTLPSGQRGVRAGRYGEQFHYEPKPPASGTLDAATRKEIDLLSREKATLDKEMSSGSWQAKAGLPEYASEQDAAKSRHTFITKRLGELLPGAYPPSPAPARGTNAPTRTAVRNPKTGKWELK
jgi:hypothetical protein